MRLVARASTKAFPNRLALELLSGGQRVLTVNLTLSFPLLWFISSEGSTQGCRQADECPNKLGSVVCSALS